MCRRRGGAFITVGVLRLCRLEPHDRSRDMASCSIQGKLRTPLFPHLTRFVWEVDQYYKYIKSYWTVSMDGL